MTPAFPNTLELRSMLRRHGIDTHRGQGDHTWINWRRYFEFASLLFR
jgi:hypothetical protein